MSLEKAAVEVKPGSTRSFGIVFTAVFIIVGLFPLLGSNDPRWWSLGIALLLLAITIIRPSLFDRPNYWWFRFGLLLGAIVAPIVMGIVFLVTVVPIGLIMRLFGKDPLMRKIDKKADSYWIERKDPLQPMKNQF